MKKFMTGVVAGATLGTVASMAVSQNIKKAHSKKTIGKTLHNLGDMAENIRR